MLYLLPFLLFLTRMYNILPLTLYVLLYYYLYIILIRIIYSIYRILLTKPYPPTSLLLPPRPPYRLTRYLLIRPRRLLRHPPRRPTQRILSSLLYRLPPTRIIPTILSPRPIHIHPPLPIPPPYPLTLTPLTLILPP